MIFRRSVAILAAILIAIAVVRNAAVESFAETRPAVAARFWSSHPRSELSSAMTEIGEATRAGRSLPPSAFSMMANVARKEPLAPEPFLVRGVSAELSKDGATAQQAFEEAQRRDPRSLPAADFLADRYFRIGDVGRALREVAALARLSPAGTAMVRPYLFQYAKNPANWGALRDLFRAYPRLAEPTLVTLSSNIATAPAVLALAEPGEPRPDTPWLAPLLNTMIGAGDYARAFTIWERAADGNGRRERLIHDSGFSDKAAPPPFNWALTSSAVGLAERRPGGRLHVIFYGEEDGILASQLLLLKPGQYRLSMRLFGDGARARLLNWSIWCDKAAAPIASVTIAAAAASGWRFTVPDRCSAQWLKLSGVSSDIHQQADLTIAALKLEKADV